MMRTQNQAHNTRHKDKPPQPQDQKDAYRRLVYPTAQSSTGCAPWLTESTTQAGSHTTHDGLLLLTTSQPRKTVRCGLSHKELAFYNTQRTCAQHAHTQNTTSIRHFFARGYWAR
jgi:hypothetical protein